MTLKVVCSSLKMSVAVCIRHWPTMALSRLPLLPLVSVFLWRVQRPSWAQREFYVFVEAVILGPLYGSDGWLTDWSCIL